MHGPDKWNLRFLSLAEQISNFSRDPSTKVGAVIVRPNRTIVATGWNGFPRRCSDAAELYEDRETKYARTVHAEVNAIVTAREPLDGCTLYVTPLHPCSNCAGIIIQAGITCVVARAPKQEPGRWSASFDHARRMFDEAGVAIITYHPTE